MHISPKFKHILLLKTMAVTFLEESGCPGPPVLTGDYVGHEQEFHTEQTLARHAPSIFSQTSRISFKKRPLKCIKTHTPK